MPRDPRLYMTFPIDFDEHPKVEPLSDAAFRTFVAMNGYSRRQRLDGRIPTVVARKRWRVKALTELLASHPSRPLVLLEDDVYVLREYAEHQFTTEDEAELHDRKARAGAKGGRAKAAAVAAARDLPKQDLAGSGLEIGITTDVTNDGSVSLEVDVGAGGIDRTLIDLVTEKRERAALAADRLGIKHLAALRQEFEVAAGISMTLGGAVELADALLSMSRDPVDKPDAYLMSICKKTPENIKGIAQSLDIGAVA